MTINVIAIAGVPGTGKTTLMNILRKILLDTAGQFSYNGAEDFIKLVSGESWSDDKQTVYILGKYGDDHQFAGTDRLSMAVQPQVIKFLEKLILDDINATVLFEGDRLSNKSFLEFCAEHDEINLKILIVDTKYDVLEQRREERASTNTNQNETFLKGRASKIDRLQTNFVLMNDMERLTNNDDNDLLENASYIMSLIKEKSNGNG